MFLTMLRERFNDSHQKTPAETARTYAVRRWCVGALAASSMLVSTVSHANAALEHYAVLSKIEANLAEIAASLAMHAMNEGEGGYGEDFQDDVADVERYLDHLVRLTSDSRMLAQIATYRVFWDQLSQEAGAIHDAVVAGDHFYSVLPRLNAWHASVEELDDFTDNNLEAILKRAGIEMDEEDADEFRAAENLD